MNIKERIIHYFRSKSAFKITTDLLFYLLILALIIPFSRKYVATGLNKLVMHKPAIISESKQVTLDASDYDWLLQDMEGRQVSFSDFKGDIVFLSFWATWCPPCRAEMPNIARLHEEFGDRLRFVLASTEDAEVLSGYLDKNEYQIPVYRMIQNPPEKLQTSSIPTTYLITGEGKIMVRKTGAAKWDGRFFKSYLERILD